MSRYATRRAAVPSLVLTVSLVVLTAVASSAQPPIPLGVEFQVSTYTQSYQIRPTAAHDADGNFVMVWSSGGQDGDGAGIFARRFSAVGVPQATEFQVNSYTAGDQYRAKVAAAPNGDFVVAWDSELQDGGSYGIFARRFSATGAPLATEFQVNVYTTNAQRRPTIEVGGDGDFVITWTSDLQDQSSSGVFARRFSASGIAQAVELQVNTYTAQNQYGSVVALDADSDFVIAWISRDQDGGDNGVFARRFDSAGTAQAAEFQANTVTANDQQNPTVAMDGGGDFVVAWTSTNQDDGDLGIFARRFDAGGTPQAIEFQVNTYTKNYQYNSYASMDLDGDFVIVWTSLEQDGSNYGIFGQRFDSAGTPQAIEFRANSYTTGSQYLAAVDVDDDGDFVVSWTSYDQDGSVAGAFARRFGNLAVLDIDGNGATAALTDGLLVLRFLFGFTGPTLVGGAVDVAGCSRCTAGDIQAYLQTLI